jgi:hypothetical protein
MRITQAPAAARVAPHHRPFRELANKITLQSPAFEFPTRTVENGVLGYKSEEELCHV